MRVGGGNARHSLMDDTDDWPIRADMLRQNALREVVIESAYLERLLRCVFTALAGRKYVAIVGWDSARWDTAGQDPQAAARASGPQSRSARCGWRAVELRGRPHGTAHVEYGWMI